jgi:hypothetical protein
MADESDSCAKSVLDREGEAEGDELMKHYRGCCFAK